MSLEKNVIRAPIPFRSSDYQSHYNPDDSYFARAKKIYEKIKTEMRQICKKEKINPEEDYDIF